MIYGIIVYVYVFLIRYHGCIREVICICLCILDITNLFHFFIRFFLNSYVDQCLHLFPQWVLHFIQLHFNFLRQVYNFCFLDDCSKFCVQLLAVFSIISNSFESNDLLTTKVFQIHCACDFDLLYSLCLGFVSTALDIDENVCNSACAILE